MSVDHGVSADVDLLRRVVARDGTAIRELYDRYSSLLFRVIMRILQNRDDAEEVLQEVFMRVWTSAERYDAGVGTPGPWLVRLARNRAIDSLRTRRTRGLVATPSGGASAPGAANVQTPELLAQHRETRETVNDALTVLPAEQRELIQAAFFEGYTHSELASRFELPLGTVKTRIRTGMMSLRQRLEDAV